MGYDTSYHPVDVKLWHERLFPFIRGEGAIDDLIADAVRIARVRFRANAWGLGVLGLPRASKPVELPEWWDSHLHVWGRPFFITCDSPEEMSAAIDAYLAARPEDVDEIVKGMLDRLGPAVRKRARPDKGGRLPVDKALAYGIAYDIQTLREAYAAWKAGRMLPGQDEGEGRDPRAALIGEMPFRLLRFASNLRPGWMSRGYTWPTHVFAEAGLKGVPRIGRATSLYAPWKKELPGLLRSLPATIESNYEVGGYAAPEAVPRLRRLLAESRPALSEALDGGDLRKLDECLYDAERLGMGFVEATEIYSGIEGVMN